MGLGQWIGLIALSISIYILWQIRQVLFLIFMAAILATALNRIVREIQRIGIKRGIAIALCCGVLFLLLVSFIGMILPLLVEQFRKLIQIFPYAIAQLDAWFYWLQTWIPWQPLHNFDSFTRFITQFRPITIWLLSSSYKIFYNSLEFFLNTLLVIILSIMFLANPRSYRQTLIYLFPAFYRHRVDDILSQCEVSLIEWLKGVLITITFIGIMSFMGLWILQIPLPLLNAIMAGMLAIIPYLGAILSGILPAGLALTEAPWKVVSVIGLYILMQQVERNFVTPVVMQKQVSLLPAFTLALMTGFGIFFGILGLFLALPIIVVAQVWLKEVLIKDILDRWQ